jgi:hypothetical protein
VHDLADVRNRHDKWWLAAAFKTAFERLSGSNVFGLMPDPSLSPDYRCRRLLAVLMTTQ